jgi:hypothetical protein
VATLKDLADCIAHEIELRTRLRDAEIALRRARAQTPVL